MNTWYLKLDKQLDKASNLTIEKELEEIFEFEEPGDYSVILHNDPLNGVDYVTRIIKEVFGYGTGKSIWLMFKAHFTGQCTLWIGPLKKATQKRNRMVSFGPDPRMIHKGAGPLKVTVEKNA